MSGSASAMSSKFLGKVQESPRSVGAERPGAWQCYTCGKKVHIKWDSSSFKHKAKNKTHKAKGMRWDDAQDSSERVFVTKEANPLIDSGTLKHMTWDKEILQEYQQFSKAQSVKLSDGSVVDALGIGNITVKMTFKIGDIHHNVKRALYSKVIQETILSGSC